MEWQHRAWVLHHLSVWDRGRTDEEECDGTVSLLGQPGYGSSYGHGLWAFRLGTLAYVYIWAYVCVCLKLCGYCHGNLIKQLIAYILFQVSLYQWSISWVLGTPSTFCKGLKKVKLFYLGKKVLVGNHCPNYYPNLQLLTNPSNKSYFKPSFCDLQPCEFLQRHYYTLKQIFDANISLLLLIIYIYIF